MTEHIRELVELKREVVEARNQVIKTDNQVKNLSLDIKGFEQRFDGLEGRVRLSSVGVNLLLAVAIALAAWFVSSVRSHAYEVEVAALKDAVREEHLAAQAKVEGLSHKLAAVESDSAAHERAALSAGKVLELLESRDDRAAGEALDQVEFNRLTPLERRACERRFDELRARQAVAYWRSGRQAMLQSRPDEAIAPLRKVLGLDPNGRFGPASRQQLGWALWQSKRYGEAEGVLRELLAGGEGGPTEEARYLLGTTLLRLNRRDDGRRLLQQLQGSEGRFAAPARAYLQAIENGGELPEDLPGGRVRVSRRLPGPLPVAPPSAPDAP